ncbi:MAG: hypothetical protein ACYSWU_09905 [Planctomycetota bacterium]|jgi:hypothetical protein
MSIPSREECRYLLEMVESGLVDFSYTHPWADQIIEELDVAPPWLSDLATKRYQGDQAKALREYVFSEPFEAGPPDLEKFHVACLWLRYERRELSWASLLRVVGDYLDGAGGDWDCETPYHYLNMHEDAYFSMDSELSTRERYLADHDLTPWIEMARQQFEPFKRLRRTNKALHRE